ncbi:conserved hypothetical protein [Paraglaciecola sp. T6c]|uniref:Tll0287-like domain-containing protein n=1 Tax=Pseudoalteromonas atlantica (strain T6c / ATCC BAA-1087) TaxID=3042615 RepID=UPI00005C5ADE|nr:DUF3365 domain-containing protein [Paraglaciecola sp. T6c]ABG42410.1 conserved hypothetical protein [Paraglaciecola sp. T6c]
MTTLIKFIPTFILALPICLSAFTVNASTVNAEASDRESEVKEARLLIKEFSETLKSTLSAAIEQGGLINALDACHIEAPAISSRLAAQSGWKVQRTSLKPRNVLNSPDNWELANLQRFEQRKEAGEPVANIDTFSTIQEKGKTVFRYMKAIPTSGLCLNCHGNSVAPSVKEKIDALYPYDEALGFTVGDIRGAFTLKKVE